MNGRWVRPRHGAPGLAALRATSLGIVLLMLLPTGFLAVGHVSVPAPRAGSVAALISETRAALAALAPAAPRVITPAPWHNLTPRLNDSPSAREGEALVYDPSDGYVLLFGGATGAGAVHDTWTFSNGRWTNLTSTLTTMPSSRYKAQIAYDAADGYVVLFGGRASVYLNDTWKWQGGAWAPINSTVAPSAREDAMMTYDPVDGYVLMFGGENQANHLLNDTWTFVGGAWANITASVPLSPPTREAGGIAWDSSDGYVLLFGGSNDPRGDLHDTWTYQGGLWTNRTNLSTTTPVKRETLVMVDDPIDGFVLMFGGLKFPTLLSDNWAYSNGSWTQLIVGVAPSARWGAEATWDANAGRGVVLLFGGVGSPTATYANDTWTFKIPLSANLTATGPTEFDLGGTIDLQAAAQGGYPIYSYGWLGLPLGCAGANLSQIACTPTLTGSYNVTAWVVDAAGTNVTAGTVSLVVTPLPTVSAALTPEEGNAPLRAQYTSAVQGGVAPFTYAWQFGDGGTSNASGGNYTFTTPGIYAPTLTVHDADGMPAVAVGLPNATVNPALIAGLVASATSGVAPLSVDFSATVSGGWAPYTYLWQLGPAGVTSSGAAPSYTFLTPGSYLVSVNVTDSGGASAIAYTNVTVTAVPPLVATATASTVNGTVPLSVTFTGGASGGSGPYTYDWSFGDGSTDQSGATVSYTYTTVGNFTATLTATDSTHASSEATVMIEVTPVPASARPFNASFTFEAGTPYCAVGSAVSTITLTASASGGTAPYSYAWTVGTTRTTGADPSVSVPAGATTPLVLNASDSMGHLLTVSHNVTVGALSCATSSGESSSQTNYLLLVIIALVAVVIAVEVVLLVRRKQG